MQPYVRGRSLKGFKKTPNISARTFQKQDGLDTPRPSQAIASIKLLAPIDRNMVTPFVQLSAL